MAVYMDEEEVWKCPNHPSKRRRSGICPTCLRERLVTLCPDCATARPCNCCPPAADSSASSSSSSSSFSLFSSSRGGSTRDFIKSLAGLGEVGRVSNLLEGEPAFRRSRSLAIPFLRSRSRFIGAGAGDGETGADHIPAPVSRKKINFWGVFKMSKNKKDCEHVFDAVEDQSKKDGIDDYSRMMRSRSVAVGAGDLKTAAKGRGWYFPSPMKVFRQSKTAKVVQERSPLHRV